MTREVVKAAAWAVRVVKAAVIVVVVFVVVVTIVVAVAGAGVVGVVVRVAGELGCWTKVGQAASHVGLCPCPSPVVGNSDSFPCPSPLLQRNKKKLKAGIHVPNHLRKVRGLMKHLLGPMALPRQRARRSRSCKVETDLIRGARRDIGKSPRAYENATSP